LKRKNEICRKIFNDKNKCFIIKISKMGICIAIGDAVRDWLFKMVSLFVGVKWARSRFSQFVFQNHF